MCPWRVQSCQVARADCRTQVNTVCWPDHLIANRVNAWRSFGWTIFPYLLLVSTFSIFFGLSHMLTHTESGHALEGGWFLLQFSAEQGDKELQRTAIDKFVELPYQYGWDKDHGGLFYFLDVDGHCPTQVNQSSTHIECSSGNGCCCIFLEMADVSRVF